MYYLQQFVVNQIIITISNALKKISELKFRNCCQLAHQLGTFHIDEWYQRIQDTSHHVY